MHMNTISGIFSSFWCFLCHVFWMYKIKYRWRDKVIFLDIAIDSNFIQFDLFLKKLRWEVVVNSVLIWSGVKTEQNEDFGNKKSIKTISSTLFYLIGFFVSVTFTMLYIHRALTHTKDAELIVHVADTNESTELLIESVITSTEFAYFLAKKYALTVIVISEIIELRWILHILTG